MTARERLGGLLAGALTGIAGGLFGVGGGAVLVPMLTSFFRLDQHQAHGTSLAVIGATALTAILIYGSHQNIVWPTAAMIALGSVATAGLGARLATRITAPRLRRLFAGFLVLVAIRLLWQTPAVSATAAPPGLTGFLWALSVGLGAGLLAGVLGVGGGILVVPVLTLMFGLSQQAAQGTSLAVMVVTAPTAALEHSRHGNVVWRLVPMLALGAALGSPLASWLVQRLPHAALVRAFALFLLITAVHVWLRKSPKTRTAQDEAAAPGGVTPR
jgi:uncharacterized membrane protein YfcA